MTLQCAQCIAVHGTPGCVATHETESSAPSCTWHLDGELCPIEQKQQRAARKKPPEETPLNANDQDSTDRASEVKSEGTMSETRANAPETAPKMCRRPGCEMTLSVGNISGLCQRHAEMGWSAHRGRRATAREDERACERRSRCEWFREEDERQRSCLGKREQRRKQRSGRGPSRARRGSR
jgi:hypothetical protein